MAECILSGRLGPKGDTGEQGPRGATGPSGSTSYTAGKIKLYSSESDVPSSSYCYRIPSYGYLSKGGQSQGSQQFIIAVELA